MKKDSPRDVLAKPVDGIAAGKWGELADLYAEDAVVRPPLAADRSALLEGRDALREHFALFALNGFKLCAEDILVHDTADPEVIVADFTYRGTETDGGHPFIMPACFIWRVRNGEVVEARFRGQAAAHRHG